MHKLAERVELEELKKCGILHGDVEEMMKVNKVYTLRVINFEGFKFSWFGNLKQFLENFVDKTGPLNPQNFKP